MEKDFEKEIVNGATFVTVSKIAEESPYGVTQKYERSNYDSPSARKQFHDDQFKDRRVVQDIHGNDLHRSQDAAHNKYGPNRSSYHEAQADHKDPVKNVHDRHKNNPLICDDDIKEIVNRRSNFQELSRHDNASKGDNSELVEGIKKRDIKRISRGAEAQLETDALIAGKTVTNMSKEVAQGAIDALAASAIPLAIRGVQNLCRVASNEMTMKEAAEDLGKVGLSIAGSGGTIRLATYALSSSLKNSENSILKSFAKANQIGTVLVIGSIVVRASGKYLDGEINGEDFFREIGGEGLSLASGMLDSEAVSSLLGGGALVAAGGVAGLAAAAAPVLAAMIASAVCSEIYAQAKKISQTYQDNLEIQYIANSARAVIEQQQDELKKMMDESHAEWAHQMTKTFQELADALVENNLQSTNSALRKIATSMSAQVALYESGDDLLDDLLFSRNNNKTCHLLRG